MSNKKVSVIIPVFNTEKYIKRCIESLLVQDYDNLEIVVVDDGSTDNSLKICQEFEKTNRNVHVYSQKNRGPSAARNLGLKKSSGEYIFFCDSDDYVDGDAIKKLVSNDDDNSIVGLFHKRQSNNVIVDNTYKKKQYKKDEYFEGIFKGEVLGRVACFLFKNEMIGNNRFDEKTNCMEDTVFLVNYLNDNSIENVKFVDGSYYYYVDNDGSITRNDNDCVGRIENYSYSLDRINKITGEKFTELIENDKIRIAESALKTTLDLDDIKRLQKCLRKYRGLNIRYKWFSSLIEKGDVDGIRKYFSCKNGVKHLMRKSIASNAKNTKKVAIVTIIDNRNLGNRLQNLATQNFLEGILGAKVITIRNSNRVGRHEGLKRRVKLFLLSLRYFPRTRNFKKFNKNIRITRRNYDSSDNNVGLDKVYDYFVVGSDQVWNPNYGWLNPIDLLSFASDEKRVAFSASYGISKIPDDYKGAIKRELSKFKAISVREERGKEITREITGRKDIEVLIDPTMLISRKEWSKYAKRPSWLEDGKPVILKYFLGGTSAKGDEAIRRIARKHDCQIVDIFDKKSIAYSCGPSEFLWLEKNAFLVCTDSFHSSVFAIINKRPFVIFEREGKDEKMNSRIETLVSKFGLQDRWFNGDSITEENLKIDYSNSDEVLAMERGKSLNFIKNALEIKDER